MLSIFLKGSVLRLVLLAATAASALFMMPYLISNLGDRMYGMWVVIGTIVGYYSVLNFGLQDSVARYVSKAFASKVGYGEVNKTISSAFLMFFLIGVIAFCISAVVASFRNYIFSDSIEADLFFKTMLILGFVLIIQFSQRALAGALEGVFRYELVAIAKLMQLIVRFSLIVYVVAIGYGIQQMALALFMGEMVSISLLLYFIKRKYKDISLVGYYSVKRMKELFSYSWVAMIAKAAEVARVATVSVLVSVIVGLEYVVFYAIGVRLMDYFFLSVNSSIGMLVPIFSSYENVKSKTLKALEYAITASSTLSIMILSVVVIFGKSFVVLWMGEDYEKGYFVTLLMSGAFTMFCINLPLKHYLYGVSMHKYCAGVHITQLIFGMLLGVIFANWFGFYGIAVGFLFGNVVSELVVPLLVSKVLGESIIKMYVRLILTTSAKLTVPILVGFEALRYIVIDNWVDLMILVFLYVLQLAVVAYMFILPKEIKYKIAEKYFIFGGSR